MAVTKRGMQIVAALGSWLAEGRLTNRGASAQQLTDARADKLRHLLTELGPAFVKIGQAVSSRCVAAASRRFRGAACISLLLPRSRGPQSKRSPALPPVPVPPWSAPPHANTTPLQARRGSSRVLA